MKTIYLIRHGKASLEGTEENRGLTDEGLKHAQQLSGLLSELRPQITQLYSSPYKRATLSLLQFADKKKLKINTVDGLREIERGSKPVETSIEAKRKLWDDENYKFEGGESRWMATRRALLELDRIKSKIEDDGAAAVITHGILLGCIIKAFDLGFSYQDWMNITMPDIFKLRYDGDNISIEHTGCKGIDTFKIGDRNITKEYLKEKQYKKSRWLEARIAIHKRFGTDKQSFHEWVWDHLDVKRPVSILDVGCGTAQFWNENYNKLPNGSTLLLTDFSEGMIEKAKKHVIGKKIAFEVAEIENLPYDDNNFDIVMCHHVVYHADDKDKALKELKRVVKKDGIVTITTNNKNHMLNIYEIGKSLDKNFPTDRNIDSFTGEIADRMLPHYFRDVIKHTSNELLKVTDADVMIDYVKSTVEPRNLPIRVDFYDRYKKVVLDEIKEKGYFGIQKHSPLYICRK